MSRDLNITQKTAWFVLHRIREMLLSNQSEQLSGTVEIDETYVGGATKNKSNKKRKELRETGGQHFSKTSVNRFEDAIKNIDNVRLTYADLIK